MTAPAAAEVLADLPAEEVERRACEVAGLEPDPRIKAQTIDEVEAIMRGTRAVPLRIEPGGEIVQNRWPQVARDPAAYHRLKMALLENRGLWVVEWPERSDEGEWLWAAACGRGALEYDGPIGDLYPASVMLPVDGPLSVFVDKPMLAGTLAVASLWSPDDG